MLFTWNGRWLSSPCLIHLQCERGPAYTQAHLVMNYAMAKMCILYMDILYLYCTPACEDVYFERFPESQAQGIHHKETSKHKQPYS